MIPQEIREAPFWLPWRAEPGTKKDGTKYWVKMPYDLITGRRADVRDPKSWHPFERVYRTLQENPGWYNGLGFSLTDLHPFSGVDLDDVYKGRSRTKPEDIEAANQDWKSHNEIVQTFNSYTEWSPSSVGLRIFVRGKLHKGMRNRAGLIEVYSRDRFLTVTGKSFDPTPRPLRMCQSELMALSRRLGEAREEHGEHQDEPEQVPDDAIISMCAQDRTSGEAFMRIWSGDWSGYPSPSEADLALGNYIGKYTGNRAQAKRVFKASPWYASRDKLNNGGAHAEKLIDLAVSKGMDLRTPFIDIEAMTHKLASVIELREIAPSLKIENPRPERWSVNTKPPGLVGDVADFIYANAARPNRAVALAGAIGFLAGIAGKAYNFHGNGLNQYVCVLADSATGKDAIPKAWSRLFHECSNEHQSITQFKGPRAFASGPAFLRHISVPANASIVSYFPEFGHQIGIMNDPRAQQLHKDKLAAILDVWSKSAHTDVVDGQVYSDTDNNVMAVRAPSFSFVAESTFGTFFDNVSADSIANGFIPRMLLVPVYEKRPAGQVPGVAPITEALRSAIIAVAAQAQKNIAEKRVTEVQVEPDAWAFLSEFDKFCDTRINYHSPTEGHKAMWGRAWHKAIKLAALIAVGVNPFDPRITIDIAQWAKGFCYSDVDLLIRRFDTGLQETNAPTTDIENFLLSAIRQYLTDDKVRTTYKINEKLYASRFVSHSYLSMRTANVARFKKYQGGAARALKDGIAMLIDRGTLREAAEAQVSTITDGGKMKAYVIIDATAIETAADFSQA